MDNNNMLDSTMEDMPLDLLSSNIVDSLDLFREEDALSMIKEMIPPGKSLFITIKIRKLYYCQ